MNPNAAGLIVSGDANPNWRGGPIPKHCNVCARPFAVRPGRADAKFCSMRCVGLSQRGGKLPPRAQVSKTCTVCAKKYFIYRSHADRGECCSRSCAAVLRGSKQSGPSNPNWIGGVSRQGYPWNFRKISRLIIDRDGHRCQNPECPGADKRLTTHHIDYDKSNCAPANLIALCSSCNSRANKGRAVWQKFYTSVMARNCGEAA